MSDVFKKASFDLPYLRIALMGGAGAGKTFTSLRLASGLKDKKRIAYIDTDPASPSSLYANKFDFDIVKPDTPEELIKIVESFDSKEYGVLVLDTITWYWRALCDAEDIQKTRKGTVGVGEWQTIKRIYREVLLGMINLDAHIIITGREGLEYSFKDGELAVVGFKMLTEKETAFETNLFIRLFTQDDYHLAEILRDRTGILQGKKFKDLDFKDIEELTLLCSKQVKPEPNETDVAVESQNTILVRAKEKAEKAEKDSENMKLDFIVKIQSAINRDELDAVAKELQKAKGKIKDDDRNTLRGIYENKKRELNGGGKNGKV